MKPGQEDTPDTQSMRKGKDVSLYDGALKHDLPNYTEKAHVHFGGVSSLTSGDSVLAEDGQDEGAMTQTQDYSGVRVGAWTWSSKDLRRSVCVYACMCVYIHIYTCVYGECSDVHVGTLTWSSRDVTRSFYGYACVRV